MQTLMKKNTVDNKVYTASVAKRATIVYTDRWWSLEGKTKR